jgi:PAS domain S-box-containing protein
MPISDKSAERLRIATEAARIGIWDWDTTTDEMNYSPVARAICGFPPGGPITFERLRDVTHPDDLPRTIGIAERALDPALREKAPYRYRIYREDDYRLRWVQAYGEAQFSHNAERATLYIGTIQDVTDDVAAEDALIESEARLRLALEVADMAVWEVSLDTFEVTGSEQLNALCGFPADAHPSYAEFQSRYAPGEFDRVQRLGAEAQARGENHIQTVIHHIWPDGKEKWLLLRAQVAPQTTGAGQRVIGVLIDVTEQQRSERRLELVAREMRHRVKTFCPSPMSSRERLSLQSTVKFRDGIPNAWPPSQLPSICSGVSKPMKRTSGTWSRQCWRPTFAKGERLLSFRGHQ